MTFCSYEGKLYDLVMSCGLFNNDILIEYNLFLEALQSIDCDIVVTRVGFCVHNYGNLEISL